MALDPKDLHTLEQADGVFREVARMVANYHAELVGAGVPESTASALAQGFQARVLADYDLEIEEES